MAGKFRDSKTRGLLRWSGVGLFRIARLEDEIHDRKQRIGESVISVLKEGIVQVNDSLCDFTVKVVFKGLKTLNGRGHLFGYLANCGDAFESISPN
jgi:hypothetical protein